MIMNTRNGELLTNWPTPVSFKGLFSLEDFIGVFKKRKKSEKTHEDSLYQAKNP